MLLEIIQKQMLANFRLNILLLVLRFQEKIQEEIRDICVLMATIIECIRLSAHTNCQPCINFKIDHHPAEAPGVMSLRKMEGPLGTVDLPIPETLSRS